MRTSVKDIQNINYGTRRGASEPLQHKVLRNRNSGMGLACVFLLTGFMGHTFAPIISSYLAIPSGGLIVTKALATTALILMALSAYVLVTGKNLSLMSGFLMAGIIVGFVGGLTALVFNIPAVSLAISVVFVMLMLLGFTSQE